MATLHMSPEGKQVLFVKGAPEVMMESCDAAERGRGSARDPRPRHEDSRSCRPGRARAGAGVAEKRVTAGSLGPADLPKT